MLALEAVQKVLEAQVLHERQQHEATAAHGEELSTHIQAVAHDFEAKCTAVSDAEEKISALQVGLQLESQASLCVKMA